MKVEVLAEVVTRDVVAVKLRVTVDNQSVDVTGSAKRDPEDKPNASIGRLLAYGRALEVASKRLIRRANGYVEHAAQLAEKKAGGNPFASLYPGGTVTTSDTSGNGVTYTISFGSQSGQQKLAEFEREEWAKGVFNED